MKKHTILFLFTAVSLCCRPYSVFADDTNPSPSEWMMYLAQTDFNSEDYGETEFAYDTKGFPIVRAEYEDPALVKIMIDPGHAGYYNPSTVVNGYYESVMTWTLSNYLKEELEALGVQADLTKTSLQDDPDLQPRGHMSAGYDFFLSVHSNAASYSSLDYPTAICYQNLDWTTIDDTSREVGQILTDTVTNVMGTQQKGIIWQRLSVNDRDGNGVYDDEWYGVLCGARYVGTPGVLMEHSFHTNYRSTVWLMQDSNLRKLAHEEAAVLADYFKAKKAEEISTMTTTADTMETTTGTTTETTVVTETTTTAPLTTTEPVMTTTVPDAERKIGDVDGDGLIMIEDAEQILTYYAQNAASLSQVFPTVIQQTAADFNGDHEITIEDATSVLQCYAEQAAGLQPILQLVSERI